jgi:hypothetical protein
VPENWSSSRDATLSICERKYYYQYLVQARLNSNDPDLREIAELKKTKSIAAWSGDVFHQVAAVLLRRAAAGAVTAAEEELRAIIVKTMTNGWNESLALTQGNGTRNAKSTVLFEHEYGLPMDPSRLSHAIEAVFRWAMRFQDWEKAEDLGGELGRARRIWIEPPLFGPSATGYNVDGVWIFARVDVAYLTASNEFCILDWKTGRPPREGPEGRNAESSQMTNYQLWPHFAFNIPVNRIRGRLVYVNEDPILVKTIELTPETADTGLSEIRRSIRRMQQFGAAWTSLGLDLRDLNYANSPGLCTWCSFKRLCQRSISGGLDESW